MRRTGENRVLAFPADAQNPVYSTIAWQLVALAFGGLVISLIALPLLPRAEVRPAWLGAGLVLLAVFIAVLVSEAARLFRSGGREVTSPGRAVALVDSSIIVVGCLILGVGSAAAYRIALLIPVVIVAVIGNRFMMASSCLLGFTVAIATAAVERASGRELLALALTTVALWGGITLMVHLLARTAIDGIANSLRLASIVAIAGSGEDEGADLQRMLPDLASYVGADQLWLVHAPTSGAPELITGWPGPEAPGWEAGLDLDQVIQDRRAVTHRSGGAVFVADGAGGDLILVVARRWSVFGERLSARAILDRAAVPLQLLIDRSTMVDQLRELTTIDELTGLPNRRGLAQRLADELASSARTGRPLCVAMLDLDHFKTYNDDFGHLGGDDVLRRFATLVLERLRATDLGVRYGGEEFCLVLPETDLRGAARLMEELLARVRLLPTTRPITCSAGVAQRAGDETADQLLGRADQALYRAKRDGRDRVETAPADAAQGQAPAHSIEH